MQKKSILLGKISNLSSVSTNNSYESNQRSYSGERMFLKITVLKVEMKQNGTSRQNPWKNFFAEVIF